MRIKKDIHSKPSPPISKKNRQKIIFSVCLVFVITFISFFPSLKNGFVNFDDHQYVTENRMIMDLSWGNIKTIFKTFYMGHYHPLTLLSYGLEYQSFQLNPSGYHTTNLILHLSNSLLVFWLIGLLRGSLLTSFIVALLFGIHPLHVESVAWISERKDVLYSFFFLGSMISYLYFRRARRTMYYYLSLFLFILSLLSKSMAVTLPLVLFLCDYLQNQKLDKKPLIEKIPFLFIALVFGIIALFAQGPSRTVGQNTSLSFFENIFIFSNVLVSYLSKLFLPIKLSALYSPLNEISRPWQYVHLSSIVGFLTVGIILGKYNKKVTIGTLLSFITILPVLPLKIVADRYTYIPSLGIFLIIGEGFSWLYDWKIEYSKIVKTFLFIVLIGVIGALSFLTWERCRVWKDSISLWNDVLRNNPNILIAYIDRGTAFLNKREYDRAISDYNWALGMNPSDEKVSSVYNNRGNAYAGKGLYDQALSDFSKALEMNPKYEVAYSNRGNTYYAKRLYEQAISDFNKALEINPNYAEAYFNKALALEDIGRTREAIEAYNKFIEYAPPQYAKHLQHARKRIRGLLIR